MSRYLPPEARALVEILPESWSTVVGLQGVMGRCIESTRLLVGTLTKLKVPCRPMACDVEALNSDAVEQMVAGNINGDVPWPDSAYVLAIHCDRQTSGANFDEPDRRKGFSGHLVVVGADWFLDVTAGQMERRPQQIIVNGPIGGPYDPADDGVDVALARGGRLRYLWRPEVRAWRTTPAWRQDLDPLLLEAAIRAVRHKLDPTQPRPFTVAEFRAATTAVPAATNGHKRRKKGRR